MVQEVFDGIKLAFNLHLLKGYTTALETVKSPLTSKETSAVYCWCIQKEFGKMITCDNRKCSSGE